MAITKEQAIDILDKFDFFQGQRAGRELWNSKPKEVQDEDTFNFSKDVALLKEYIADVVPRSELVVEREKCLTRDRVIKKQDKEIESLEKVIKELNRQKAINLTLDPSIDVARRIFKDIKDFLPTCKYELVIAYDKFTLDDYLKRLEKKYIGEKGE